jgi:hypothetical protein
MGQRSRGTGRACRCAARGPLLELSANGCDDGVVLVMMLMGVVTVLGGGWEAYVWYALCLVGGVKAAWCQFVGSLVSMSCGAWLDQARPACRAVSPHCPVHCSWLMHMP